MHSGLFYPYKLGNSIFHLRGVWYNHFKTEILVCKQYRMLLIRCLCSVVCDLGLHCLPRSFFMGCLVQMDPSKLGLILVFPKNLPMKCTVKTLISLDKCQADLSLCWVHTAQAILLILFPRFCYAVLKICEPQRDKTNNMTCAPSKDSDQPGHPPSLIRVFTVRMKKP